ncbi:MAG: hypothetical protein ABR598_05365 [Candidatus Dormibacteria bacterium]
MKRIFAITNGILAAVFLLAPAAVFAAPTTPARVADNNRGDTWLQTVGPCKDHNAEVLNHNPGAMDGCGIASTYEPAPGDENRQAAEIGTNEDTKPNHTPHLPCANIEVMAKNMASPSGNYHIDLWPPTGDKVPVYGTDANGKSVVNKSIGMTDADPFFKNGHYTYVAPAGNPSTTYQVVDIVDVDVLIHNSILANAQPPVDDHIHPIQGYHFKLDFNQDDATTDFQNKDLTTNGDQKHKTFWVRCPAPTVPPVVTPPPPPPPGHTGSVEGVTYYCRSGQQTADAAPGTITIGSVSGASSQTATGLTSGTQQAVSAQPGAGLELVDCGAPSAVHPGCTISGMNGTGTVAVPDNSTATVCFYEQESAVTPPPSHTGNVEGVIYYCQSGQLTEAPGTITIGSVSGASPKTATGLSSGTQQTVTAQPGPGLELVDCGAPTAEHPGCTISGMGGTGTVTVPNNNDTATVCFFEKQTVTTPPPAATACVGEEYMLQGTTIVIPGGTVSLTGKPNSTSTPTVYCDLTPGQSVTGTSVQVPDGYTLVPGTQPITETLVAGTNPEMIFFLNLLQTQPDCGKVLGTIVLAGTNTMVPGGTVTETGTPTVTTYPSLLGGCQPAGQVPVSATAPAGYTFFGPSSTTVTIVNNQVTPVVFQVTPFDGGTLGSGTHPANGSKPAAAQGPLSGVLGAATMPLTGFDATKRIAVSLVCVALGLLSLVSARRLSRES